MSAHLHFPASESTTKPGAIAPASMQPTNPGPGLQPGQHGPHAIMQTGQKTAPNGQQTPGNRSGNQSTRASIADMQTASKPGQTMAPTINQNGQQTAPD